MTEKWIVDDCGTLINMETRENYDYMEEVVDLLNGQDDLIKDKEELIKAKNQQLENVKQILTYHKKLISYMEEGLCAPARLQLIKQILNELGWDSE